MGEKRAEQKQVTKKINIHRNRDGELAKRARGGLVVGQLVSACVCVCRVHKRCQKLITRPSWRVAPKPAVA